MKRALPGLALLAVLGSGQTAAALAAVYEVPLHEASASACDAQNRTSLLVQETEHLLGHILPEQRRQALRAALSGAAQGLLSACKERSRAALPDGSTVATVDATINVPQLHSRLLGLGTLHTRAAPLEYTLDSLLGEEGSAAALLSRLELAGGMVQRAGAAVRLDIRRDKGRWEAVLIGPAGTFRAVSPSLEHLWSAVWGPYFLRQQELAPSRTMALRIWGWKESAELRHLERTFRLWGTALRGAHLGDVQINSRGTLAQWTLEVIDPAELADRLAGYAANRGLHYELQ